MKSYYERHNIWIIFILGIILIVIGEIIYFSVSSECENIILNSIFEIIKNILLSTGIAIIVSVITFDINKSHEALVLLNNKEKKEMIKTLVCSGDNTQLDEYKEQFINTALEFAYSQRSNVICNVTILFENNKIYAKTTLTYNIYLSSTDTIDKKIKSFFYQQGSEMKSYTIINYNNPNSIKTVLINSKGNKIAKEPDDNSIYKCKTITLPKEFQNVNTLKICEEYIYISEDNWINYNILFTYPLYGVDFSLNICEKLLIKEFIIAGDQSLYSQIQGENTLQMSCMKWVPRDNGFFINIVKK